MYYCVVSDYCATGEGKTVCILITRAYPDSSDYDDCGTLKNSGGYRALREFIAAAGSFHAHFAVNMTVDELITKYGNFIPTATIQTLRVSALSGPGNFHFYQSFHVNYS